MRNTLRLLSIAGILSAAAVAAHADIIAVSPVGPINLPVGTLTLTGATTTFNAPTMQMQMGTFSATAGGSGSSPFTFSDSITITPNGGSAITHSITVMGTETLGATPTISFNTAGTTAFGNLNLTITPATFGVGQVFLTGNIVAQAPPSAVPEPSSIALLGTGVLSLAGVARRKFMKA